MSTESNDSELQTKYQRYAARKTNPLPFEAWLQFHKWGVRGGRKSKNDKVAAGKAGAAALRRKLVGAIA